MLYRSNKASDPLFFHSGGKFDADDPNLLEEKRGWYFSDETWSNYHGPYASYGECELAIERYVKEFL